MTANTAHSHPHDNGKTFLSGQCSNNNFFMENSENALMQSRLCITPIRK